jgi:MFS family permease
MSDSTFSDRVRNGVAGAAHCFSASARNPSLLRAQLAFGGVWTAEWAFTVAIAVVAFRDGGAQAVGVVAFARMVPSAVLAPFGTTLADRFPRDRFLIWSCLVRGIATGVAAIVLVRGGAHVAVYGVAIVATAAFTTFRPAHSALLPALCRTPLELTSAIVVRGLLDSLSTLIGPLGAALLIHLGGPAAVFATSAALTLGAAALLLGLSYEAPRRRPPEPLRRVAHETLEGFQALWRYRAAGLVFGLGLLQTLTRGCFTVLVVVVALELLAIGAPGVGLLTAAVGAGAVAGSLGASMFVSGRRLAVLEGIGVVLWGLPLTLSGAFPHGPVVLALICVIGVGNALVDIGLYTLPARVVPEEMLARVFGAKESLTALSVGLGALIAPVTIELLGIRGALVVLGLVAPAAVALSWRRLNQIDTLVWRRDAEIQVLRRVDVFGPLPMPALDQLALHVQRAHFTAGQEVFHQGERGDRFYVIERGEVDVIGDGRLIRTMGPGDSFGEIALLRDRPRTTTIRARTPLRLSGLDRSHFLSAVSGYESSARRADAVVLERLGTFNPAHIDNRWQARAAADDRRGSGGEGPGHGPRPGFAAGPPG